MRNQNGFTSKARWLAAVLALSCSACVVGPDYKRPEVAQPDSFRGQVTPGEATSFADLPWWEVFKDPELQALLKDGLANNQDLAIAASRIEQARALVGVARSEGQPQVGYDGGVGVEQTFVPQPNDIGTVKFVGVRGALNAAWELDVWGRIKRSTESARANLFAQEEVRRGVMMTLVSDIASGYFRMLSLDRELAIAQESNAAYGKILELFTLRYQAGKDSNLPVERAQALYDSSSARVAELRIEIAQQENALGVLTGGYPRPIPRGVPITQQVVPPMPLGLTTDLIRRRPDIRQREQEMIRANAEVGVAVANFYPRIGLSALLGGIWVNAEHGIDGTFGFWNLAAGLTGPIFTGGRLESLYDQRKAFWDESIAQYRKTIQIAFQETADALAAQQNLGNRRTSLESQVGALQRSINLAMTRYDAGRSTYFEVLESQQQLFPAQDVLARVQLDQMQAMVALYKALGGGWQVADQNAPQNAPQPS